MRDSVAKAVVWSRLQITTSKIQAAQVSSQISNNALPKSTSLGYVYLALSATGVIFLPTTAKLALQSGSDVLSVAFARGIVATLILILVAALVSQNLRMPRHLFLPSLAVGVASALFVYGMYGAILTINISLALLILFLFPMMIATWEHLTGISRIRPAQWLWGCVAIVGMALILGVRYEQVSFVGVALATMAMLASVVITLVNTRIVNTTGSLVANMYMSLWTLLLFGAAILVFGQFTAPQTTLGWSAMIGNGVAYCVSWVAFFSAAKILGATRAAMITLCEPALAALFGWLIFGENFSLTQWFGFAVVLASLFMFEKLARDRR